MMKKIIAVSLLSLFLAVTLVGAVSAQPAEATQTIPAGITTVQGFVNVMNTIADWVFVVLVIVAVVFIVLAGLQFITGGGDPTQISAARTKLIWAAVGIGVALLARGLPAAIQNLLGV